MNTIVKYYRRLSHIRVRFRCPHCRGGVEDFVIEAPWLPFATATLAFVIGRFVWL